MRSAIAFACSLTFVAQCFAGDTRIYLENNVLITGFYPYAMTAKPISDDASQYLLVGTIVPNGGTNASSPSTSVIPMFWRTSEGSPQGLPIRMNWMGWASAVSDDGAIIAGQLDNGGQAWQAYYWVSNGAGQDYGDAIPLSVPSSAKSRKNSNDGQVTVTPTEVTAISARGDAILGTIGSSDKTNKPLLWLRQPDGTFAEAILLPTTTLFGVANPDFLYAETVSISHDLQVIAGTVPGVPQHDQAPALPAASCRWDKTGQNKYVMSLLFNPFAQSPSAIPFCGITCMSRYGKEFGAVRAGNSPPPLVITDETIQAVDVPESLKVQDIQAFRVKKADKKAVGIVGNCVEWNVDPNVSYPFYSRKLLGDVVVLRTLTDKGYSPQAKGISLDGKVIFGNGSNSSTTVGWIHYIDP